MRRLAAVAAGLLVALGGCSSDAGEPTDQPAVIEVTIADGEVTPTGEKVDVSVGQEVTFVVTSDAADELHVHGEPEKEIEVQPGMDAEEFTYTPEVPGQIAVEAHHADVTVVTLVVTK